MAQFKTFSGLRTYTVPLQRDLRNLERWIRETEGRLATLISGEPISAPTGGSSALAPHASSHEYLGSDPVESVNKLWVGKAPVASQSAGELGVVGDITLGDNTRDNEDRVIFMESSTAVGTIDDMEMRWDASLGRLQYLVKAHPDVSSSRTTSVLFGESGGTGKCNGAKLSLAISDPFDASVTWQMSSTAISFTANVANVPYRWVNLTNNVSGINDALQIRQNLTGTIQDGHGLGIGLYIENSGGTLTEAGAIASYWTDVSANRAALSFSLVSIDALQLDRNAGGLGLSVFDASAIPTRPSGSQLYVYDDSADAIIHVEAPSLGGSTVLYLDSSGAQGTQWELWSVGINPSPFLIGAGSPYEFKMVDGSGASLGFFSITGAAQNDNAIVLTFDGQSNDGTITYDPSADSWTFSPALPSGGAGGDSFLEWAM